MNRTVRGLVGGIIGALVGGGVVLFAMAAETNAPPCPMAWAETSAPAIDGAVALRGCRLEVGQGMAPLMMGLYRSKEAADSIVDRVVDQFGRGTRAFPPNVPLTGNPDPMATRGEPYRGTNRVVDVEELPLFADVYFLSGGRKFGLLSIVHTEHAPFANGETVARWLETLRGAAPWGAENPTPFSIECPRDFTRMPNGGPFSLLRCGFGDGTESFTTISLSTGTGGLGSEQDRTEFAREILARATRAQGEATIIEPPTPFTLARNVDAIRARSRTSERVPRTAQSVVYTVPGGDVRILGAVAGNVTETHQATLKRWLANGGFLQRPFIFSNTRVAVGLLVLLALIGAFLGSAEAKPAPKE